MTTSLFSKALILMFSAVSGYSSMRSWKTSLGQFIVKQVKISTLFCVIFTNFSGCQEYKILIFCFRRFRIAGFRYVVDMEWLFLEFG